MSLQEVDAMAVGLTIKSAEGDIIAAERDKVAVRGVFILAGMRIRIRSNPLIFGLLDDPITFLFGSGSYL